MLKKHRGDSIFLSLKNIFFAKRTFHSQKEHFLVFLKKLLILYLQLPHVVKDILTSTRNQNCWNILHSTTVKLVFCTLQKFVFGIVLYSQFAQAVYIAFLIRLKNTKIHWISSAIQGSFYSLDKASVNWIQLYFNLLSGL